jgi:hypothetical protein
MRRCFALSALAIATATATVSGGATRAEDAFGRAGRICARDFARNNHWPEPFIYQDRDAVVRPFAVMIAKGWQVHYTMSDHHFQPDNSRLADAGVHKLQQILGDPVPQRRMVYVQLGTTPEQTMARINAVRAAATVMLPPGMDVAVFPSGIPSRPWPGSDVQGIHASFDKSRGPVKLPAPKVEQ